MKKFFLALMGGLIVLDGILYLINEDYIWSFVVFTLAGVYLFGFEKVSHNGEGHIDAHILTGGLFIGILAVFIILEKLSSLLSDPKSFSIPDIFLISISVVGALSALIVRKNFV